MRSSVVSLTYKYRSRQRHAQSTTSRDLLLKLLQGSRHLCKGKLSRQPTRFNGQAFLIYTDLSQAHSTLTAILIAPATATRCQLQNPFPGSSQYWANSLFGQTSRPSFGSHPATTHVVRPLYPRLQSNIHHPRGSCGESSSLGCRGAVLAELAQCFIFACLGLLDGRSFGR